MDAASYDAFTVELRQRLATDPHVQGLILLGSTADPHIRDEFSDHDFWIIADSSAIARYSDAVDWLPNAGQILLTIKHGPGRRTVVYRNRHKTEFAVFDVTSAKSGKIERFRVDIDRNGIAELADEIHRCSTASVHSSDGPVSIENFFVLAWSGHERALRGELLSAQRYVQLAVDVLLQLLGQSREIAGDGRADRLDGRRRLEQRSPELARELNHITVLPAADGVAKLVTLAERELAKAMLLAAEPRIAAIRGWLADAR